MRILLNSICVLILAGSLAAAQTTAAKVTPGKPAASPAAGDAAVNLPTEATVDSFLQQTFGYQPDLTWRISGIRPAGVAGLAEVTVVLATQQGQQLSRFYVAPDGEHALTGDIIPFGARPFDPAMKILEKGITGPQRGPKDAPVIIVEFGDLQCPACKRAQPEIEALVAAEPNARFVFQNFPLGQVHNWAVKAADYADCVGRASSDAFWKFIAKTYETQSDITAENVDEKLTAIADGAGVKGADIAACAAKPETKAHVDASIELGKAVDVTSTPTLFINGRKVASFDPQMKELYKSLVEFAAKQPK
ncbi:DSBA oxidoreductase [Candidatus Sulfotelmatobacter kueseliae]|uniref:DSBA oxidoreductase n=1 Tax=Candidatus Sulfotelmatobacter kueseliae TaxID=2042962 RepID=A0A2U3K216_9BACT|nr:DSBA oxidoreductase [Candidatus Sulfotelmatobacter kueseliae]